MEWCFQQEWIAHPAKGTSNPVNDEVLAGVHSHLGGGEKFLKLCNLTGRKRCGVCMLLRWTGNDDALIPWGIREQGEHFAVELVFN